MKALLVLRAILGWLRRIYPLPTEIVAAEFPDNRRTAAGLAARRRIDELIAAAAAATRSGDALAAGHALNRASDICDRAGGLARAIQLRNDAADAFAIFAERGGVADRTLGYTLAARTMLAAGDIERAKDFNDLSKAVRAPESMAS
jgi:hypothetical protein